jgi:hypothetical protein
MLRFLTWPSRETSPRLTPDEVDTLARFTFDVAQAGQLTEGKYIGATIALYWQRMNGGN